ncbi:MAG: hypothetical protein A2275_15720 [Bacteroidetes bacterium RIFOXYA12_FULL_35_11]|nr:MAG: hypothetical protein A2X01_21690 [Bacteroidetes bacterium GWF2_35_48]OFY79611.1 MAG: hypothetical protein A2275_15720 [Bacteroidetes bacterium RIFOXYA12_FULL_35_11]OFY93318.1 MAG: hypothetical protein A2491_14655 [Bacteroidetes bacterium RIFOXYC12_FULL_35_7]OFY94978.1 MAG: hypothetical protein A2309_09995 [Bacteroidetes bacterium RIFOXYB2_FULL_35_7]HBX50564.1 metallophosphoesterase [Bacteroidales bacterium]
MKVSAFIIFISIVLVVYSLVSYYLFIRGYQAISGFQFLKIPYIILFFFFTSTYIIARLGESFLPTSVITFFHFSGSFWLGAIVYFLLLIIFFDLIRLANHFFPFYPKFILQNYAITRFYLFLFVIAVTALLLGFGYHNARNPVVKNLSVNINKSAGKKASLKIVCASDIHLGWIIGRNKFSQIVDAILSQNPDIILLAGDIVDEDIQPVINQNLGEDLLRLKVPLGIYAVTGNHEYIGGIEKTTKYLTEHGITILRDTFITIENSFHIAGRIDKDAMRFAGRKRKELSDILNGADKNLPLILMDHQPFKLNEAVENGVDLQLSGHTHSGQLWPGNLITNKIFELSHGYMKKQNTHFYVSSGVGTWGPPVRIGNKPEIVVIDVRFDGDY